MLRLAIAFLVGNLIVQQLSELPGLGWLTAAIIAVVFCMVARWVPFIAGVGMGFFWTLAFAQYQFTDALDPALEGVDVSLVGTIVGIPSVDTAVSRFELAVDTPETPAPLPGRLRLSWYGAAAPVRPGQRWQFTVRLKRPHGFSNPGGFDYEGWLFRRGIGASGYVRASPAPQLVDRPDGGGLDRLRQFLASEIHFALQDGPSAGIATALAVGDRSGIDPRQWEIFAATGTSHLMAISGLHVGLVSGLVFVLIRWAWPRLSLLCRFWPAAKAAAFGALLAASGYAALAGFSLPTRRALIMLGVALGAVLLSRANRASHALAAALLLVLLLDPSATLAPGFWLSFGAVAVIVFLATGRLVRPSGLVHWGSLQLGLGLALAPLLLWFFHGASLVAPLANAVAIPWVGLVVVPLILIGTVLLVPLPALGQAMLSLVDMALSALWPILGWLAALPFAEWTAARPGPMVWLFGVVGTLLLLAPRGVPARWLGVVLLLPLALRGPERLPNGAFELTVLDVGQGLASVVETSRHVLVFDAGARLSERFDLGRAVVVPFLRSRGVDFVDRIVVSHGDIDHSGGVASLLRALPAGEVLGGPGVERLHAEQETCRLGQHWSWDGVDFEVLHPPPGPRAASENDGSCVIRVSGPGGAALLTADIEAEAEARLIADHRGALAADVLVVPHHGSGSSSSGPFIDAVSPALALVSAGYRNRYGFPKMEVCQRYAARGVRVLETAAEGSLRIRVSPDDGPTRVQGFRRSAKRYWHIPKDGTCSPL